MSRTDPPLRIRLPKSLKEQVQALAAQNHRSMNAEIVARLERTVQDDEQAPEKGMKFLQDIKKNTLSAHGKRLEDLEQRIAALEKQLRQGKAVS